VTPADATRPSHPSLAANLTRRLIWIAAVVTLANVVFVAIYYGSDRESLEAEVIRREMTRLEAALIAAPTAAPTIGVERARLFEQHPQAYGYALLNADGEVLEQLNPSLIPPEALTTGTFADDWLSRRSGPHSRRLVASHVLRLEPEQLRVVFVMDADPAGLTYQAIFSEFMGHIWLPLVPIALLLIGANALMIRRGLAPLGEAAAWARAVQPGQTPRPFHGGHVPAEIADLTDATMRLHERLDAALAAEKRHAAEAAHALRTPLAALIARLDALPAGETTERLRADLASLSRTVRQLLASAGAERFDAAAATAVDLERVAEGVVARLAPFAIARGAELALVVEPSACPAFGFADKIELALANVVENAVIHGGGLVEVRVGPGASIRVRDGGPGLRDAADAIWQPFWRGREAEPGGAGLGLAIVDRIQRAHGGEVSACDAPDGGAVFRLVYPPA
jgi:two-component system OmpR family sensor kinase